MQPPEACRPIPKIRAARDSDLGPVVEIENDSFGAYSWSKTEFAALMAKPDCTLLVAEVQGLIVGVMAYERQKTALYLLSLAVGSPWRRAGLGSALLANLVGRLNDRPAINTHISEYNLPGQLFLRACGFRATRVLPGFFAHGGLGRRPRHAAYLFEFVKASNKAAAVR